VVLKVITIGDLFIVIAKFKLPLKVLLCFIIIFKCDRLCKKVTVIFCVYAWLDLKDLFLFFIIFALYLFRCRFGRIRDKHFKAYF